jgi:hypothetical protein
MRENRFLKRLHKRAKKGLRGWPVATHQPRRLRQKRKPRRGNTGVFKKERSKWGTQIAPDIKQHRSVIV